jgi:hypothetical protein
MQHSAAQHCTRATGGAGVAVSAQTLCKRTALIEQRDDIERAKTRNTSHHKHISLIHSAACAQHTPQTQHNTNTHNIAQGCVSVDTALRASSRANSKQTFVLYRANVERDDHVGCTSILMHLCTFSHCETLSFCTPVWCRCLMLFANHILHAALRIITSTRKQASKHHSSNTL